MPIIFSRNKILKSNKTTMYTTKQINCYKEIKRNFDLQIIQEAANQNDSAAIYILANMYYTGHPVKRNLNEAARLFRKAAELGVDDARKILLEMVKNLYDQSCFPILYHATLLTWDTKLIQQFNRWVNHYPKQLLFMLHENSEDSYGLILTLLSKNLTIKFNETLNDFIMRIFLQLEGTFDFSISKVILEYLFEENLILRLKDQLIPLPISMDLTLPTLNFKGVAGDDALSIRRLNIEATEGNVEAVVQMGDYFMQLPKKKRDVKEAFSWYHQAAIKGYLSAQMRLALCYEENIGVGNGLKQAIYWYAQAAEQKDNVARQKLTTLYDKNLSVISPALIFHAAFQVGRKDMVNSMMELVRMRPSEVMLLMQEVKEGSYQYIKSLFEKEAHDLIDQVLVMLVLRMMMPFSTKLENNALKLIFSFLFPASMTQIIFQHIKPIFYKPSDTLEDLYLMAIYEKNLFLQLRLMYLAAEAGNVRAQLFLGKCYMKDIMKDPEAAIYWCKRALLQGDDEAKSMLDVIYSDFLDPNKKSKALESSKSDRDINADETKPQQTEMKQHDDHEEWTVVYPQEFLEHEPSEEQKTEMKYQTNLQESIVWCRLGLEEKYDSASAKIKELYENNRDNIEIVYHAAISLKRIDMLNDLIRLTRMHPKKFVALLRKNPKDSFESISDYFETSLCKKIRKMLKDPKSHEENGNILYRFFSNFVPRRSEYEEELLKARPR